MFVGLILASDQASAQDAASKLSKLMGRAKEAVHDQVVDVKDKAMRTYTDTPRAGSCEERRSRFVAIMPAALRFGRYARDIYTTGHDDQMEAAGEAALDIGGGRTAYRDSSGKRYAEILVDQAAREVVVIFRGTRVNVASDIYTDVAAHVGLDTGYYNWAADLVTRAIQTYPGMKLIVTGQSLGGGLTLYAVLKNPGVIGYAFNPAGLSLLNWAETGRDARARVNSAVIVVSTRNEVQIEPITALSFAGRSVIPGHIFVVETPGVSNERTLHGPANIVSGLEALDSNGVAGPACEGDLGVIAR